MNACKLYLKKGEEQRLLEGHPWVFSNEIDHIVGFIKSGEIAYVYAIDGTFIGKGYLNTNSKIFVRILTKEDVEIDEAFFYNKILKAKQSREDIGYQNSYRAFFGESDGIPGLIVDKYGDYLSIQILSLGIDQRKPIFIKILKDIFNPKGILERSDVSVRTKEGLELFKGVIDGIVPEKILIKENELTMAVDLLNGQKTGFFLDQQDNHNAVKPYVKNKTVLDCFSNIGGFGLHAAYHGAKDVTCVDISALSVKDILYNASLNGLSQVKAIEKDVFEQLRAYQKDGVKFDTIILDPPAFAKNKEAIKRAYQGYKDINLQAMKIIEDGGYLYTCSCSHYMTIDLFLQMLQDAARDAKKKVQMVEMRIQSKDHPALLGSDESLYLKCVVLRVLNA
ncbi:class I SAM-dependent rRNA methyltransferase [Acholeplasma vituli]|uniref:Class I SAM-dependent rRNA methyltransferase n=1 Tax=Paracholeplasma vituli TaxID=69473 RepID=A0ABT2PVM9_9MOLU|nr:class I SAM-dependent rRNA methyltransferase [Paracholeplasma vituli]MCU0104461.1 class I SAM-dependent rRNA methyltransferase [Paracholeplasma vituli]